MMRMRLVRGVWSAACVLCVAVAVPWHVYVSRLASGTCATAPVFDPIASIGLPSVIDADTVSLHAQALSTAMLAWAVLAYWRTGTTGFYLPALLLCFILQPVLWIGNGACRSLESPMVSGIARLLFPVHQFDIDGLVFLADPPITLVLSVCIMAYRAAEDGSAWRRAALVAVAVYAGLFAIAIRRTAASGLVCSVMLARLCSLEGPRQWACGGGSDPARTTTAAATGVSEDSDMFKVTDSDGDDTVSEDGDGEAEDREQEEDDTIVSGDSATGTESMAPKKRDKQRGGGGGKKSRRDRDADTIVELDAVIHSNVTNDASADARV